MKKYLKGLSFIVGGENKVKVLNKKQELLLKMVNLNSLMEVG